MHPPDVHLLVLLCPAQSESMRNKLRRLSRIYSMSWCHVKHLPVHANMFRSSLLGGSLSFSVLRHESDVILSCSMMFRSVILLYLVISSGLIASPSCRLACACSHLVSLPPLFHIEIGCFAVFVVLGLVSAPVSRLIFPRAPLVRLGATSRFKSTLFWEPPHRNPNSVCRKIKQNRCRVTRIGVSLSIPRHARRRSAESQLLPCPCHFRLRVSNCCIDFTSSPKRCLSHGSVVLLARTSISVLVRMYGRM